MDFTCVNCSRLATASFTSDNMVVYRCNICDMEYRLITGCIEKQSAQSISIGNNKLINESDVFNAMPIKVQIIRP